MKQGKYKCSCYVIPAIRLLNEEQGVKLQNRTEQNYNKNLGFNLLFRNIDEEDQLENGLYLSD